MGIADSRRTTGTTCSRVVGRTDSQLATDVDIKWTAARILVRASDPWILQYPTSGHSNSGLLCRHTCSSEVLATCECSDESRSC